MGVATFVQPAKCEDESSDLPAQPRRSAEPNLGDVPTRIVSRANLNQALDDLDPHGHPRGLAHRDAASVAQSQTSSQNSSRATAALH